VSEGECVRFAVVYLGMGNGSSASSQFLSKENLKALNQLKRDAGRFRSSRSSYGGGVYDKGDYGDFEYE